jgi:hypothetical protein
MIFLFGAVMGVEKKIIKKRHSVICSHVWSWERTVSHWICSHVWFWQKTTTLQRKYLKTSMVAMNLLRVGLIENQDFKNYIY